MKIIPSLSHMPFLAGDDLFFCRSRGEKQFVVAQTEFAKTNRIRPQTIPYQPWELARVRGGVIHHITAGFPLTSPSHIFCNPVVVGDEISFVYDRKLWSSPLSDSLTPQLVLADVYTGFVNDGILTYRGIKDTNTFTHDIETVVTDLDQILRIIPSGDSLIITGKKDGDDISLLRSPEGVFQRITVGGGNVYKCCLDGDFVIHAKRAGGFETRHIHRDPVELLPYGT